MRKGILVIVIVLLSLLGLGFFQYQQLEQGGATSNSLSALTTAFSASLSSSDADMTQVNDLLSVLDQVSVLSQLDTGLFSMPDYTSLRDFSVTLFPAQSIGRTNPFLGIDEGVVAPTPASPAAASSGAKSGAQQSASSSQSNSSKAQQQTQTSPSSSSSSSSSGSTPDVSALDSQIQNIIIDSGNTNNAQQPITQGEAALCDPFTDPTCFDNPDALNAFINSTGGGN